MQTAKKPVIKSSKKYPYVDDLLSDLSPKDKLIQDHLHVIKQKDVVIEEQQKRIALLEEYLRLARVQRFGRSSEKTPGQGDLFDEAELEVDAAELKSQLTDQAPVKKKKPEKALSSTLPRYQIHLNLTDEEKEGAINTFYTTVKEELDIVPAKVRVLEYLQEKAVFIDHHNNKNIVAAKRPQHPLGKTIASVSLLAYIIIAKYCDALPLYRLEKILGRYGGSMTRTAMAGWIIRLHDVFMPLINLMREHQLTGDYLQADETRLQVLKEPGKSATSDKWMWLIRGGPPQQPVVLFDYDASRRAEVPSRLLDGFSGTLQTDGYAGYNKVCAKNNITHIGCWDHARRKFVDASKAIPQTKKKKGQVSKADIALSKIRKLYAIEKAIEKLLPEQRCEQRQLLSVPVLNNLKEWLDKNISKLPKDSLTHKAMSYTLNQWNKLTAYCDNGDVRISNILAENAIRPLAIGRKNWLFSDTPRGAHASATCYSLIETAKANGLEPYDYILHILRHIAEADTVEKLEELLPWNVKL
ncbi:MAG: IS66 family transposase [Gammaproteobacteria bacterium]|nr:MAG: IS66 family transposase [Gammaproteobacteria bacterium]